MTIPLLRAFVKSAWKEDAMAFRYTCATHGVPASIERSRSGNGAHVWIFFSEQVPARLARRLGSLLLTETMEPLSEICLLRLSVLAKREEEAWRQLDGLIATKHPNECDEAIVLLCDLRDLCARTGRQAEAMARVARLREEHGNKPSPIKRIRRAGLGT